MGIPEAISCSLYQIPKEVILPNISAKGGHCDVVEGSCLSVR
jgi:hypothetical protein